MESKLNRIDYTQVGLTSKNVLKSIKVNIEDSLEEGAIVAVVGDHAGSIHCFALMPDSNNIETIFKTLPGNKDIKNAM